MPEILFYISVCHYWPLRTDPQLFLLALAVSVGTCREEAKTPAEQRCLLFWLLRREYLQCIAYLRNSDIWKLMYMFGEYVVENHGISDTSDLETRVHDRA